MKNLLLTIIAISSINLAKAQFYSKISIGINTSTAKQVISQNTTTYNTEFISGSFGKGISPSLGIGYLLNKNWGLEIGINYLIGSKVPFSYNKYQNSNESVTKATTLGILPSVIFKSEILHNRLSVYSKVGLILTPSVKISTDFIDKSGPNTHLYSAYSKSGFELGYTGGLGLIYSIYKKININFELSGISLSAKLKTGKFTKSTYNGVDNLPSYGTSWIYTDNLSSTASPNEKQTVYSPMSSIGISLGIIYNLGN